MIRGFFFIFPLTAVLIPIFPVGNLTLNAELVWMLTGSAIAGIYLVTRRTRPKYSPMLKAYALFLLYFCLRTWVASRRIDSTSLALIGTSLFFLGLIENLPISRRDMRALYRQLIILAFIMSIVSVLQFFVSPTLFYRTSEVKPNLALDGEYYRSASIFAGMEGNQSGIAMLGIFAVFLFSSGIDSNKRRLAACLIITVSILFSLSRYIIVGATLMVIAYIYDKHKNKIITLISVFVVGFLIIYFLLLPIIVKTELLYNRATRGIEGRYDAPLSFIKNHLWEHPFLFGIGFSSYSEIYYYPDVRRLHSGNWDLLFHVGVVGLILFALWLKRLYQFGRRKGKESGSILIQVFVFIFIFINFTARLNFFYYWGYLLVYFIGLHDTSRGVNLNYAASPFIKQKHSAG